ncbi:hypothetical protein CCR75_008381 [Bremia lactucae]|uniref:RRM domain-containing protein n=1 Tax=Bremia lactucae TaxID=4779 RepID=A0A976IJM8_BRELC|nr:hypothetical protein CCR75_008381 [Bremia lactucae]
MAEDMLTELYAWDSEIEDVSALAADDPKRDEDKAEDAYEKIIHAASGADANDVVLSLAAQLLHKHFFRFPHVQLNVVDVLLKLCGPKRSQAVRIHTLRALLQIVKTPPDTAVSTLTSANSIVRDNSRMWMLRIDEAVSHILESEKSSVILRQVTPLRQALEERLQPNVIQEKSNSAIGNDQRDNQALILECSRKQPRDEKDITEGNDGVAVSERDTKKPKLDDEINKFQNKPAEAKFVQLKRDWSSSRGNGNNDIVSRKSESSNGRIVESEGRRPKVNAFSPRNCPPCPYLFLGSVPRHTPSGEIVEFLSPVWPEIDNMSVQIKQPDHNATAYAFVSMPTIEHARLAIHYVNENKFRGRAFLNANFARGPPVDTILFVERTGDNVSMEDKDAVRDFNFDKYDPEVWDVMCQQLERFGPLSFAEKGCVRFRSAEHAKAAIRKQLFTVMGHDIFPVYDIKEQFAIDSTRRGSNVQPKQGFALKSGRLVGGDAESYSSKDYHSRKEIGPNDGLTGRHGHDRVLSLNYGERSNALSRSPLRSDRASVLDRSRSRSPKSRYSGGRYDLPIVGSMKEHRMPRSRSRSPLSLVKHVGRHKSGYGTSADKENFRELRSKFVHRSPSPIDVRSYEKDILDEECRGRQYGRKSSGVDLRLVENFRDRRELAGEGQSHKIIPRVDSPTSSSSRRYRKNEIGSHHFNEQRHNLKASRHPYRREELMEDVRGRMPPSPPGGVLHLPRSLSRSPPRFAKNGGSIKSRVRSRSRSPHVDVRAKSRANQRPGGYHRHEDLSAGSQLSEDRPAFQVERPRYADDRSIAEVARDEQHERQRFFQQQSHGRRDFIDADLSRYGSGRVAGRGGCRGDKYDNKQPSRGDRNPGLYHQEVVPMARRSRSPLPLITHHRSVSPLPQPHRRSLSPFPPTQQKRETYGREHREEFKTRGRNSRFSPPQSPLLPSVFIPGHAGSSDIHASKSATDDLGNRLEQRYHSRHDKSRDDKSYHHQFREKRPSHLERSLTPSPARRERPSGSVGRKASVPSPHRSVNRRNEGDNILEEVSAKEISSRPKDGEDAVLQQKEIKSGGARMAREELFAGMDDLTVDYEEDDDVLDRSRSRSPKSRYSGGRYDLPIVGSMKEHRMPRSRSRSPLSLVKHVGRHKSGYGTSADKENFRELRSKFVHRSPSPIDVRSYEKDILDEECRGRQYGRKSSGVDLRLVENFRDRRELAGEGQSHKIIPRVDSPTSSSSRRYRKNEIGSHHFNEQRHNLKASRHPYRREELMEDVRGRMPPSPPGGVLHLPRSLSRSPPRFAKNGGSIKSRVRSRSRSPHVDVRAKSRANQRPGGYHRHEDLSAGSQLSEDRPAFQVERPRYADDRSIAEVARDEQHERQRFFQQQSHGRRDFIDADLSRYGSGRVAGRGGCRGDKYDNKQPSRGDRNPGLYHQEVVPMARRSRSPLPLITHHRSVSPLPQPHRRSLSPFPPTQQKRETYGREHREEFKTRGRNSRFSPPQSPLLPSVFIPGHAGSSDIHASKSATDDLGNRLEQRYHSRHDKSRDDKSYHHQFREKRPSHLERSLTPSPARRERPSGSVGRKASVPSPHRSVNRRNEGDNILEEVSAKEISSRPKDGEDAVLQQKEIKSGGARMAREELFAGMDDLTVDYEEDDE